MSKESEGQVPAREPELADEELFLDAEDVQPEEGDPLLGRVLNGRYDLQALIGEGGMGRVYRAVQQPLGRKVAIKVLHPTLPASADPHFQRRFLQEAALTAKLHSPHTVSVLDYGQTEDGVYFLAMEYLEGETLLQTLQRDGALPWAQAVQVAQQICRSLKEAHAQGVVHRDLKPANIILIRDGEQVLAKVLDFGLVKTIAPEEGQVDPEITQRGTFLGSPTYMSPEQARNESDVRSDVYSLGVLIFHMLMGRPPFVSADYVELLFAHHRQPPPPFRHLNPHTDVPPQLEAVVRKCLEKAPDARWQSMDELLAGLREASVAAGLGSGIFRMPPLGAGTATLSPSPVPAGPMFSAFTRVEPGALTTVPGESGPHEDATKAYSLAADLGVVLPEKVKAKRSIGSWVGLGAGLLLLAIFAGIGVWSLVRTPEAPVVPVAVAPQPEEEEERPLGSDAVRFRVMSEPAGARVLLRGKEKGRTPFLLEVPPDENGIATVELTFVLEGYAPDTVVTGGSGDVVLMQRLVKRTARRAPAGVETVRATVDAATETPETIPAVLEGGAPLPTGVEAALRAPAPTAIGARKTEDVLPFGEGMDPPMRTAGPTLEMPREALTAGAEGTMVLKCTISERGSVSNCRVLKEVPFMRRAVLDYLTAGLYSPVSFNGTPVSVDYVFNVRIIAPKRR
jgi:serine/threonine-protein kinase